MFIPTYLLNRCPTKKLRNITTEESWSGTKPSVSHLKVFGSILYMHVSDLLRIKLDDKVDQMIFVECHSTSGYKLNDHVNNAPVISKYVVVD